MLSLIESLLAQLNSDDLDDLKFLVGNHLDDYNISSDVSGRQMFESLHQAIGTRDFLDLLLTGFHQMEREDLCEKIVSYQNSIGNPPVESVRIIESSVADNNTIPVAVSESANMFPAQNEIQVTRVTPLRSSDVGGGPTSYSFEPSVSGGVLGHGQQVASTVSSLPSSTPMEISLTENETEPLPGNEVSDEIHLSLASSKVDESMSVDNAADSLFHTRSEVSSNSSSSDMSAQVNEMNFAEPIEMTAADMNRCIMQIQKIGEGGFGVVYKGVFKGKEVAVKIRHRSQSSEKSFQKEKQLAFLRYTYLMPILAYSNPEGMIMYPYMEGGDLTKVIKDLDWRNRIRVFYQCSEGLAFLHRTVPQIRSAIIHGDIKPDNILLDACLNARLGDVGIAAELPQDASHCTATSNNIRGTNGYIDPFSNSNRKRRKENDIFSLGIVGLQLLKWQPAILRKKKESRHVDISLAEWLYETFGENFMDAEQFIKLPDFVDRAAVWKNVNGTLLKDFVELILSCVVKPKDPEDPNKVTRITADVLAGKLGDILAKTGLPKYVFPSGDNAAEPCCLYCCFRKPDSDLSKDFFTDKCSDECLKHFCRYCCEKAFRNPLHCLEHGPLPHLMYAENGYAILISGFDDDDQRVFDKDVENMYKVLIDPKVMGFRKENVHRINNSAANKRQEITEKLLKLRNESVGMLIVYYSGHGDEKAMFYFSKAKSSNIKDSELSKLLEQINCSRLLVILDCCSAGQYKVLPQTSLGRIPDWRIQLNGASADKECSMGDDDKSLFTHCLIRAINGGHLCPLSEKNCCFCEKFRKLSELRGYIDVYDIIAFCSEHSKQEAQNDDDDDPEANMMAGALCGQSKLAPFNKKQSMYTFRFQNKDNCSKLDFSLVELKTTCDEILSELWDKIKSCPSFPEPMNWKCLQMTGLERGRETELFREDLDKHFNRGSIVQVSIRDQVCNLNVNRNVVVFGSHKKFIDVLDYLAKKHSHWFTEKKTVLDNFSCIIRCGIVDEIPDGHPDEEMKQLLEVLKSALAKANVLSHADNNQTILGLKIDVRENFMLLSLIDQVR